jgi:superfamily I DNA/RNA helicase
MPNYAGRYVVHGPPGTGKTTFIGRQVMKICESYGWNPQSGDPSPVCVCSLTRSAAREVAGRKLPIPAYQIGTIHSMAYRQIGSPPVAEAEIESWNEKHPNYEIRSNSVHVDIDEVTGEASSFNDTAGGTKPYQDYCRLRAMCAPVEAYPPDVQAFAMLWNEWKHENGLVDFSDMIDIATEEPGARPPGGARVVIVDEAQDVSKQEHRYIQRLHETSDAVIFAGDSHQSIFRWRGADDSIFRDPSIDALHTTTLKHSFRLPRAVKDRAVAWLKGHISQYLEIPFEPRDADGEVVMSPATYKQPNDVINRALNAFKGSGTFMIVASCNYMLKQVIEQLRSMYIPFSNPWRTKNGAWNPIGRKIEGSAMVRVVNAYNSIVLGRPLSYKSVSNSVEILQSKGVLKNGVKTFFKQMKSDAPNDTCAMNDLDNAFTEQATGELRGIRGIENRMEREKAFGTWLADRMIVKPSFEYASGIVANYGLSALQEEPRVHVGTIHSIKGSTVDEIAVFPDLSNVAFEGYQFAKQGDNSVVDEIVRVFYVAMTRAREKLTICCPLDQVQHAQIWA